MPEELDQTPDVDEKPSESDSEARQGTNYSAIAAMVSKSSKKPASKPESDKEPPVEAGMEEYDALLEDRPAKLSPAQAGFVRGGGENNEYPCDHCVHWFVGPAAKRSVCEIVRPDDGNEDVEEHDHCRFWTKDLEAYPALKPKKPAGKSAAA